MSQRPSRCIGAASPRAAERAPPPRGLDAHAVRRRGLRGAALVLLATLGVSGQVAWAAPPSARCDALLPVSAIAAAVAADTARLAREATGVIAEDDRHCHRRYRIGATPASDELIFMVSPARDPAAARAAIAAMAREAQADHDYGLSRPEGLGDAAVHFRRRDPLSSRRMGLHVAFALDDLVVELGYHNVDDGERNKFVQASAEVEAIARGVASRMRARR